MYAPFDTRYVFQKVYMKNRASLHDDLNVSSVLDPVTLPLRDHHQQVRGKYCVCKAPGCGLHVTELLNQPSQLLYIQESF